MDNVYTMEDWRRDGTIKVQVGQFIDEDIFFELRDCVPPKTLTSKIFQVGEAASTNDEGKLTYSTYVKVRGQWMYTGLNIAGSCKVDRRYM